MNTAVPRQDDLASLRLLEEIERTPDLSQREISRRLGVSLGMTNLLIRRMAKKAWIKVTSLSGRRALYAMTPKGMAEKLRKTRDFVRLSIRYYAGLRRSLVDQIRSCGRPHPRVALHGAGELVELVTEAVREAGGRLDRRAGPRTDVVILLERPSRGMPASWERQGTVLIDLT